MLKVLTVNVRGMRKKWTRTSIFRELKKIKADICLLQECHVTKSDVAQWSSEWKGLLFYNECSNRSQGEIILLSKDLECQNIKCIHKSDGILAITLDIDGEQYICMSIYAPNNDQKKIEFFTRLQTTILEYSSPDVHVILGGDFNCMSDPNLDNLGGRPHSDREIEGFRKLVQSTSLCDIWRTLHPNEKQFTWRHLSKPILRRIDYMFVNERLQEVVMECSINDFPLTDHKSVLMSIGKDKIHRGPSYWKMNNSLLKDKEYVDNINDLLSEIVADYSGKLSKKCLWEFCKKQVKDFTCAYSKGKAAMKRDELADIKQKLEETSTQLCNDPCNKHLINNVTKLKQQLDAIHITATRGAEIRSKALWAQEGEKSSKFFLNLEKSRGRQKAMSSLKTENAVLTDQKDIMEEQVRYYKDLYTNKGVFNKNAVHEFIQGVHVPRLDDELKDMCDQELSVGECGKALKQMKNDSSPGSDGLTVAWYKVFWNKVADLVLDSFLEGFQENKLSISQRKGILTLLYKGKGLERDKLTNWRPISLTNVDYKILTKTLANRLKSVMPEIVHEDQNGFIKDRGAHFVIRTISDIIEYTDAKQLPGILVSLDYSKAFDSISKEYMIEAFKIFGFGSNFVRWLEIVNNQSVSCINYCGWLSSWFQLERGIRQGCPLSPMCFVVACELLSNKIRQTTQIRGIKVPRNVGFGEVKLVQFADDATLLLSDEESLCQSFIQIELFSQFSGLVLNKHKTEAIWLGCWKFRRKEILNINWNTFPNNKVKVLGITMYSDRRLEEVEENWKSRISKCENIIKSWSYRNLSLIGKIVLVKSLLASQFVYLMQCMFLPCDVLNKLNTLFSRFVWSKVGDNIMDQTRKIIERVKRDVMKQSYGTGGLNMVDMNTVQNKLCFKWILRLNKNPTGRWAYIPLHYYDKLGIGVSVFNSNSEAFQVSFLRFIRVY